MTITVYEAPGFSRCAWTIRELNADVEVRALTKGEGKTAPWAARLLASEAELQAVLEEDEQVLSEPGAICTYLADRYASRGLIGNPGSWRRAMHDEWCSRARGLEQLLMSSASLSDRTLEGSSAGTSSLAVAAITEHNAIEARRIVTVLERFLEHSAYLVPNEFSVTDIIVSHVLNWADLNRMIDAFPNCLEYLERLRRRPACSLAARRRHR